MSYSYIYVSHKSYVTKIIFIIPLKTTAAGNKYVLTFTDYYTKFVDFYPLKEKGAGGVARGIKTFVCRCVEQYNHCYIRLSVIYSQNQGPIHLILPAIILRKMVCQRYCA